MRLQTIFKDVPKLMSWAPFTLFFLGYPWFPLTQVILHFIHFFYRKNYFFITIYLFIIIIMKRNEPDINLDINLKARVYNIS